MLAAQGELALKCLFAVFPGMGVDGAFDVQKVPTRRMEPNDIQFTVPSAFRPFANFDGCADELAVVVEPFGGEGFEMVHEVPNLSRILP